MPKARTASFGFLVEIIKSEKIYFLKHIPRTPLIDLTLNLMKM